MFFSIRVMSVAGLGLGNQVGELRQGRRCQRRRKRGQWQCGLPPFPGGLAATSLGQTHEQPK